VPHRVPIPFRCDVFPEEGRVRVRLRGELDISTVPLLEQRLREARDGGGRTLVVDLSELEFMDSTGLTLLVRWARGAARDGYDLALVRGEARVHRLFELTALDSVFAFVEG
jgi:anti-sigma B factor antagonist